MVAIKLLSALNELKIYDDAIEKSDCINHVHKRLRTGLCNLLKVFAEIKGDKDGLAKGMIEKLTNYYRNSIMANTTKSKDPTEIDVLNRCKKLLWQAFTTACIIQMHLCNVNIAVM